MPRSTHLIPYLLRDAVPAGALAGAVLGAIAAAGCSTEVRRINKGQTLADVGGAWTDAPSNGRAANDASIQTGFGSVFTTHSGPRLPGLTPIVVAGAGTIGMAETSAAIGTAGSPNQPAAALRTVNDDDAVTLIIPGARELLHHVLAVLAEDNPELFVEQVLSEVTRDEFLERELDPADAFTLIAAREQDVMRLFNAMPQGERTPGVYPRMIAKNVMRVQLPPSLRAGLNWTGFDMRQEGGHWRLRWFLQ